MNMCKQAVTIVTVAAGDKLSASALICVSLGSVSGIKKPKYCYYSQGLGVPSHILSHTTLKHSLDLIGYFFLGVLPPSQYEDKQEHHGHQTHD